MLQGTLTLVKGGKQENEEPVELTKEELLADIEKFKRNSWKSESVFYLNGNVDVKLTGKTYGVKATLSGTLIESEKNKPYSIYN